MQLLLFIATTAASYFVHVQPKVHKLFDEELLFTAARQVFV